MKTTSMLRTMCELLDIYEGAEEDADAPTVFLQVTMQELTYLGGGLNFMVRLFPEHAKETGDLARKLLDVGIAQEMFERPEGL